jgi:GntR family histidine utilization transcriptional repressor
MSRVTYQDIQKNVLNRINMKEWEPGDLIPNEEILATQLGCARATVNRALRELAQAGVIDRKRKGGTRVSISPIRKALFDIPIIRKEVENKGYIYSFKILSTKKSILNKIDGLSVETVHKSNGVPYAFEQRWVNLKIAPGIIKLDLNSISINEWLVTNIPISTGTISFSSSHASEKERTLFDTHSNNALLIMNRETFITQELVTKVRLSYPPGHKIETTI